MNNSKSCGAPNVEGAAKCERCGANLTPAQSNVNVNAWSIAAAILALLLVVLCLVTAFVDSSTFINRMYTTAVEWNLPLFCLAAIVLGFITARKEGAKQGVNYLAVVMLVVAFGFSNITKNRTQDIISNADNIVSVLAEGVSDNASNIGDWLDDAQDAVRDAARAYDEYIDEIDRRRYGDSERYYNQNRYYSGASAPVEDAW